ncbi:hypothetical protein [Pseudogemmobacter bohemicus]|uniref:hypothetical protein n=1 Tax=Pseudogemmobacter bohemicus TaxID=2250708 RepID=UPI000DD38F29|nr:hypothetical protein [Pseudogemmobacter bohemicus]
MRPGAGDGLIWSGRPRVALQWRRTSLSRVAIGLVLVVIGVAIAPWAWTTGIEGMQTVRGRRFPGLGGALVALSGAALVAGGLYHTFWPVFGPWTRLRFRSYALSRHFAIIHTPFTGTRSFALVAGQQITLEEAGAGGGSGTLHGSVWFRTEAIAGDKPARRFAPLGLAPRNIRWRRIGFEQIPDAPHIAAMMRAAIAALPES